MEEASNFAESTMQSADTPREPEDVLDIHLKRAGASKKAPSPLAVALFREGLEKENKIGTATDKLPVSTKRRASTTEC